MSNYSNNCNTDGDYDAVPIKVNRVFDSCSDKDCVTGVRVNLTSSLCQNVTIVKSKCITVSNVCMNVEPIPFNKGFYSVDITFKLDIELAAYETACGTPTTLHGNATVSKNCILYGSETNSRTFSSDESVIGTVGECCNIVNPPTAIVQAVSPIVLESKIVTMPVCCEPCIVESALPLPQREVFLTIGLFYVVELVRQVTVMVPTYPYTIPQKECCSETDSPCEIFDKIRFPVEEFSPKNSSETGYNYKCGSCGSCGCGNAINSMNINPPPLIDNDDEGYGCSCSD